MHASVELDAGAKIEITQLDRTQLVRMNTEDVLRLQITMGDTWNREEERDGSVYACVARDPNK